MLLVLHFMCRSTVLTLLLLAWNPLQAQTFDGTISGFVTDPSGLNTEAKVTATQLETGIEYSVGTSSDGYYQFIALPAGNYDLHPVADQLTAPLFRVTFLAGANIRLDLPMQLMSQNFIVDVIESTPLIEAKTSGVTAVIERHEMRDLPLNQRVFLPLTLLIGGTHSSAPGSELSTQNDSGLHIAGAREASNNFLLDGIDNNDLYINRIVISPPLDSVQEFRLHASGYKAEFGRSAGAQINVISRSGSKDLLGSAYHYLRNNRLDSKNYFDPAQERIPPFRRNQFGASLGGPLLFRKTFFFTVFEGTRIRDAVTRTAAVPPPELLTGDFSQSDSEIFDPFTQAPFPENRIPLARQNPVGNAIAEYWPAPNRNNPIQNFISRPAGNGLINKATGRFDYYTRSNSLLLMRHSLAHNNNFSPFEANSDIPGFGSYTLDRGHQYVLGYQFSGPYTAFEVRYGGNKLNRKVHHQNSGQDISAELGIQGLSNDPELVGFPGIEVPGFASLSDDTALPIRRDSFTHNWLTNTTRTYKKHTVKSGFSVRTVYIDGFQGLFGRGQFNFLGAISQHPVSDLLLGYPSFSIQTHVDNAFQQRTSSLNLYAQDDWSATNQLTLSLGLRYEANIPATDKDDRFSIFDLENAQLVPAGTAPFDRAGYTKDRNNFAPRIGIAWSPGDAMVLRGSYGIFYNLNVLEANSGLYFNPPYFNLSVFSPSQTSLPSIDDPFSGGGFTPPASVNAIQPDFRTGYAQHWNLGVERVLPGNIIANASYIGSKGTKLLRRRDLNQPQPGQGPVDSRRQTPGFANIVLFESGASSIYHSGVFLLTRRFAQRTGFRAAYTWAKSIDDVSAFLGSSGDQAFPQDSSNFRAERALSNFDQKHRLVVSMHFEIPFQKPLLRNWNIFAIGTIARGRPLTPQISMDNSNTGNTGGIFGADRPNLVSNPVAQSRNPEMFYSATAFATAAPFTFGNAGRNILTGPSTASLDFALVRKLQISEHFHTDIRAEIFNLSNHTNFVLPERFTDLPTFGRILAAGQARQMQLGLRFSF